VQDANVGHTFLKALHTSTAVYKHKYTHALGRFLYTDKHFRQPSTITGLCLLEWGEAQGPNIGRSLACDHSYCVYTRAKGDASTPSWYKSLSHGCLHTASTKMEH
jgi:hypothetical protein